ncbi:MAG: hypothetical protein ACT4N2_09245 [Hyphomicrobium sp.]
MRSSKSVAGSGIVVHQSCRTAAIALVALLGICTGASAETPAIAVELNKLEQQDKGCRAYMVVTNKATSGYETLKLDLVMFQTDGVIGRRFTIDLGPIRPDKKVVKLFTLEGTPCDGVGSLLINDIVECKTDTGAADNCLAAMTLTSITKFQLSK